MIPRDLRFSLNAFHWLCGIFEGEGTFTKATPSMPRKPRMSVGMTDQDVMERVVAMTGTRMSVYYWADDRYRPVYRTEIVGGSAVALMQLMRPQMSVRRQRQIDEALLTFQPKRRVRHKTYTIEPDDLDERDRYWLAALLEGEGSFGCSYANTPRPSPLIEVTTVDADVIQRVHGLWHHRYDVAVNIHVRPPRREGYQAQYHLAAHGAAARAIMADIAPIMGQRRRQRIAEVLGMGGEPRRAAESRAWYDVRRAAWAWRRAIYGEG